MGLAVLPACAVRLVRVTVRVSPKIATLSLSSSDKRMALIYAKMLAVVPRLVRLTGEKRPQRVRPVRLSPVVKTPSEPYSSVVAVCVERPTRYCKIPASERYVPLNFFFSY